MNIGVFAMDPGGSTGLAWGVYDWKAKPHEAVAHRMVAGSTTVVGDEYQQIAEIVKTWRVFFKECVKRGLPPENVFFVAEDWVPWGGGGAGKEGSMPERVLWGVIGYRMGQVAEYKRTHKTTPMMAPPITLQLAGQANTKSSGKELRTADAWIVGKEHERSAWKHTILFIRNYQQAMKAHA